MENYEEFLSRHLKLAGGNTDTISVNNQVLHLNKLSYSLNFI